MNCLRIVLAVFAGSFPAAAVVNLEAVVQQADAIVVGRPSGGVWVPGGLEFRLSVVRSVHGDVEGGQALHVLVPLSRDPRIGQNRAVDSECGVFFLKGATSNWRALGNQGNSPFFEDSRVPFPNCEQHAPATSYTGTTYDKAIAEVAVAARQAARSLAAPFGLFDLIGSTSRPSARDVMEEFSRSEELPLRIEGVAWRVARGDAVALVELVDLVAGPARHLQPSCFSTAVFHYFNLDQTGIAALARVVFDPEVGSPYLKQSAAHALRNIHTTETISLLAAMLDSDDAVIRGEAVSGLTEFVLQMRPAPEGREKRRAREEALNPGLRKSAPSGIDNEHLHMGPFQDEAQEKRVTDYWRQWWRENGTRFPTMDWR